MKMKAFLLVGALMSPLAVRADSPSTFLSSTYHDGIFLYTSPLRLRATDLPVALGAVTIFGGSVALDRITRRNLYSTKDTGSATGLKTFGDVAQFGGPLLWGVFAINGWATHDDYETHAATEMLESFLWAGALSYTLKISVGRTRPYATDDPFEFRTHKLSGSFPSGHTTCAFAAATTLSAYYPGWKVALPAYAVATGVAFSRIYSNQHWSSDIVGGALLGFGVARALWKHHQKPSTSSWDWHVGSDGVLCSRTF